MRDEIVDKPCRYNTIYGYIYAFVNTINGHTYIGKHHYNKPEVDESYHGSGSVHWKNALAKYGASSFDTRILAWISDEIEHYPGFNTLEEVLNYYEILYIETYGTYLSPTDYNETPGGDGLPSELISGELNPMYGKTGSMNPMYGKTGTQAPWWGKQHTEEQKRAISKALTGRKLSQSTKDLISKADSSHSPSDKQIQAVIQANHSRKKPPKPKKCMWNASQMTTIMHAWSRDSISVVWNS